MAITFDPLLLASSFRSLFLLLVYLSFCNVNFMVQQSTSVDYPPKDFVITRQIKYCKQRQIANLFPGHPKNVISPTKATFTLLGFPLKFRTFSLMMPRVHTTPLFYKMKTFVNTADSICLKTLDVRLDSTKIGNNDAEMFLVQFSQSSPPLIQHQGQFQLIASSCEKISHLAFLPLLLFLNRFPTNKADNPLFTAACTCPIKVNEE